MGTVEVLLTDFERTLVRLFGDDSDVERQFLAEVQDECVGRHVPDSVLKAPGSSPYSLWMKAYKRVKQDDDIRAEMLHHAVSKIAKRYEMNAAASIRLFDDVPPVLERFKLAGIAVVIVSNNATAAVELVLEKNDAKRLVDHVVGREYIHKMVGNLKPKPNLLVRALKRAGHDAGAALLVGDSVDDMRAGRKARIRRRVALLEHSTATRLQLRTAGARHILQTFGDLPDLPEIQRVLGPSDASVGR